MRFAAMGALLTTALTACGGLDASASTSTSDAPSERVETLPPPPSAERPPAATSPMSWDEFDAHAWDTAARTVPAMSALADAAETMDHAAIAEAASRVYDITSAEIDWLRDQEEAGLIPETICYFEAASGYSRGIFDLNLAAASAMRFVETGDSAHATLVADFMTSGSDELQTYSELRESVC
jgi:hypothetical protein